MKLIRFGPKEREKPGILLDGRRLDCSAHFHDWDRAFFLDDGLAKLEILIGKESSSLPVVPEGERWAAPVARPGAILCIGLNFSDHASESGMEIPGEPVLFMKASNTLAGPYDPVVIPKNSRKTDWEVELALVLAKDVLYLDSPSEAEACIAGYCIMNDISEREFQLERGGQWDKGKSCPGFSPLGPFLATRDEAGDVHSLKMQLSVNGELRQDGSTSTMIFKPAYIVYYLSQFMQMEAGDVITTGTPPGVGLGMKPPQYLKPGDVVELSISRLGSQRQEFIKYGS